MTPAGLRAEAAESERRAALEAEFARDERNEGDPHRVRAAHLGQHYEARARLYHRAADTAERLGA